MSAPNDDQAFPCHTTILYLGREGRGTKIVSFANLQACICNRFHGALFSFKERSALLSSISPCTPSLESSVSIAKLLAAREDESRIRPVKAGPSTAVHKVPFFKVLLLIINAVWRFA